MDLTGPISLDELRLVQKYILLGYMQSMLDQERKKLENDRNILRGLFSDINETVFDWIYYDLLELKKEFKARQIKVVEGEHSEGIISHEIWCRGHKKDFPLWREHAKSEIARRFGVHVGEIEARMKKRPTR